MTRPRKFLSGPACLAAVAIVAAAGLAIPQAQALKLTFPGAAAGASGPPPNLNFNNSNVTGNIELGGTYGFVGTGPGTITGVVQFAAPDTGQFMPGGVTVRGGATFNNANVQTDFINLYALSQGLRNEGGTPLLIAGGGSVDASTGMSDPDGTRIFTATIAPSFIAGTSFTINGTGDQFFVANISTGGLAFDGSIVLTGGITSDHVLFNFDAGSFETNTGGDPLMINTGGNPTTGTYLDPNGPFQITDTLLNGRIFGGNSLDSGITNSTIIAPSPVPAPVIGSEPASLGVVTAGLVAFGILGRRRRRLARPAIMLSARDTSG